MARVLDTAMQAGPCPPDESDALREAVQQVRWEMHRVVTVRSDNREYWQATVDGTSCQPELCTLVLRASQSEDMTKLVRCRIETAIVEHLECRDLNNA